MFSHASNFRFRNQMLTYIHSIFRYLPAVCAVSFGLVACVGSEGSASSDSLATEYYITVSVDGRDVALNVQVSSAMAAHYSQTHDHDLNVRAVEEIVGDRVRQAIEDMSLDPANGDGVERWISVDFAELSVSTISLQAESNGQSNAGGCLVYMGTVKIVDDDGCWCKYIEYDDEFYNQCNGTYAYVYVSSSWSCRPHSPGTYCP